MVQQIAAAGHFRISLAPRSRDRYADRPSHPSLVAGDIGPAPPYDLMPQESKPSLRRALGFWDLVFYYLVAVFSLRWIATAAAAGPSAVVIWLIACFTFFIPLMLCTMELSSRHPEEGGPYVWSKRAFGGFAGFMTAWTYWASNLPYFPSLLYFTAANLLFVGGESWRGLSDNTLYFIVVSLTGLILGVSLNILGLDVSKWLHNIGSVGGWLPAAILIALGGAAWLRFGSATEWSAASLVPATDLKDVIFWSTIAFAFGGLESASTMGEEIRDPRRTIPRALLVAGLLITLLYVLGTVGILLALPRGEVSGLQGIMQAIHGVGERTGFHAVGPVAALLITLGSLGAVGAWFAATARLPFVAGIDRYLPAAFGRLHPKYGTPHVALLVQAAVAAGFILLGQAGTNVRGAYEVLVSMGIISYFIPFLFMFAATIRLQREPAGPGVIRVPGGKPVAVAMGVIGFLTTSISIVFATIPSAEEPNRALAATKIIGLTVLLLAAGASVYLFRSRHPRNHPRP